ncbi:MULTISPECIES: DNA/RNA non-specific endonuclease [unclassified Carboxylicivirga]|uniref:DNA/RNA non-specific endonuclease n=1 Tax=Carboxylicivirga TaxID=1628153 RepID=UPI003D349CA9
MHPIKFILTIAFVLFAATSHGEGLAPSSTTGQVIKHNYYSLSYSEADEQPEWVYYTISKASLAGSEARTDNFRPDPKVTSGSATLSDYKGSGFDRGHLAPAGSMKHSRTAMSESFYLSNMSPQLPAFNRGIWKNLESLVRDWARNSEEIHVVTGPILNTKKASIGANKVSVPGHYYKIVYDPTGAEKMIALILPNEACKEPLQNYVVSVDKVESLTGIDFFASMNDDKEARLEAHSDISAWKFTPHSKAPTHQKTTSSLSGQCRGTTQSTGQRCRNKTSNTNGYCHHHQGQARH